MNQIEALEVTVEGSEFAFDDRIEFDARDCVLTIHGDSYASPRWELLIPSVLAFIASGVSLLLASDWTIPLALIGIMLLAGSCGIAGNPF